MPSASNYRDVGILYSHQSLQLDRFERRVFPIGGSVLRQKKLEPEMCLTVDRPYWSVCELPIKFEESALSDLQFFPWACTDTATHGSNYLSLDLRRYTNNPNRIFRNSSP